MGASGCVAWNFERKGMFLIPAGLRSEDELMELALEAGADDVQQTEEGQFEITCSPITYDTVAKALATAGIVPEAAQLSLVPKDTAKIEDVETAALVLKLIEMLDDHDDIQTVSSNYSIPDEIMEQL